jgi:hypothetical protein
MSNPTPTVPSTPTVPYKKMISKHSLNFNSARFRKQEEGRMKCFTLAILCMLMTVAMTATAFGAKGDNEIDFSAGFATAPYEDSDLGWGLNVGGGYEFLEDFTPGISGDTLQLRGDIGYHTWSVTGLRGLSFGTGSANRVPATVSCRYYFPIRQVKNLRVYGQAGLELSFDHADRDGYSGSHVEVNVGVTPGVGVEYKFNNQFFLTAGMKEHLIADPYFTMQGGLGFLF